MAERIVSKTMAARHILNLLPSATVWEAACTMTKANSGNVLVMEASGELLGILTERDLMTRVVAKALEAKKTLVSQVMTPHPHTVSPDTTVSQAVLIMIERGFRHLPVISQNGHILGVFSARDALPREVDAAMTLAEFHEQINDAMG
ncbi:MAG: CBS domain-containing protein [Betaproteobacteria bacterium]|jgi:CBS domain-containing protein|nr:CBS domain-containing protein [Betaproteobacteria bacterium]NBX89366.1 CBS domain-containing protein [Betaproteobacteria bacterium]